MMAHARLSDEEMTDRAALVFREQGYQGTSLSQLSKTMGMEKASLYYRYPGGKDEIALAVVVRVGAWFAEHVLGPLRKEGTTTRRVQIVARRMREFYGDGARPCMLDTLSLVGNGDVLQGALQAALRAWLEAFVLIAQESGMRRDLAVRRAEQAVVQVEGALVVSRVLGDRKPFLRVLAGLPGLLTTP